MSDQEDRTSPSGRLRESVDLQLIETAARAAAGAAARVPHSSDELILAEAAAVAGPRLLVEHLQVGALQLLCEVHLSGSIGGLPFAVDTHRCAHMSSILLIGWGGCLSESRNVLDQPLRCMLYSAQ